MGAGDVDRFRQYAEELVAMLLMFWWLRPTDCAALQQVTRTIPIVFATATDPVGAGW
jgi:ABC-type uncharacterized transport system substrate-binding protein